VTSIFPANRVRTLDLEGHHSLAANQHEIDLRAGRNPPMKESSAGNLVSPDQEIVGDQSLKVESSWLLFA
jgi:hypothetical protein